MIDIDEPTERILTNGGINNARPDFQRNKEGC